MGFWQTAGGTLLGVVAGGAITLLVQIALLDKRAKIDRTDRLRAVLGSVKALYLDINPDSVAMSLGPHSKDQIEDAQGRWRHIRPELLGTAQLDSNEKVREAFEQIAIDLSGVLHLETWLVADYLRNQPWDAMHVGAKDHFAKIRPNLDLIAEQIRGKRASLIRWTF